MREILCLEEAKVSYTMLRNDILIWQYLCIWSLIYTPNSIYVAILGSVIKNLEMFLHLAAQPRA